MIRAITIVGVWLGVWIMTVIMTTFVLTVSSDLTLGDALLRAYWYAGGVSFGGIAGWSLRSNT